MLNIISIVNEQIKFLKIYICYAKLTYNIKNKSGRKITYKSEKI